MQTYSTVIVIDSLLKSEDIENTIEKVQRNIKNNGGEIIEVDRWGKKRLSYMIKKRQYGYYVEIFFKASGDAIKVIEREYALDENILRYLTTAMDRKNWDFFVKEKEEKKKKQTEGDGQIDESQNNDNEPLKNYEENATEKEVI